MKFITQSKIITNDYSKIEDILNNILINNDLPIKELYNLILTDNNSDNSRKGFIFEAICKLLLIAKCLKITYDDILQGQLQSLTKCKNIKEFLNNHIHDGNNPSDLTLMKDNDIVSFSVKYRDNFIPNDSDVQRLNDELLAINKSYKIGLIVKDKTEVINHRYKNTNSRQKLLHDKVISDNLLLDENDIIVGLEVFKQRFKNYDVTKFIQKINIDYLLSPRQQLILKLHQQLTILKFINNHGNLHLIAHKPRSGKSITILSICKYLLDNNKVNRILIMTSVPATIKSFIDDLNKYLDFQDILYVNQDEFKNIPDNFKGIVFCSVQYLKNNSIEKKELLKQYGFDVMIIDESHMGSSTSKTEDEIINIDEIRNNIKINIFASGTGDKTKRFYNIKNVYEWEIEDEGYMKQLLINPSNTEIVNIMINRHGSYFTDCYNDITLNKDYTKCPTQVLIKDTIPQILIEEIKTYNINHNTNYGYSCATLFALNKTKDGYDERFELEMTNDGIELLKGFFEHIISNNRMNNTTIMKQIEATQFKYKSRLSTNNEPQLFIIYLPVNTRNNTIDKLQTTIIRFINQYNLWTDYNLEYSNSTDDSSAYKQEYNEFIQNIMNKTKDQKKRGCILLLGNKGSVGITYHNCDATISLDDGHNLDNQKQRFSRALTEANGKTIGINVDMNIQRTYLYLNEILHKHKRITKTTKTNAEILEYLYRHNIFLFNPNEFTNGNIKDYEILEYYKKETDNMLGIFDDSNLLEDIVIDDDDLVNNIDLKLSISKVNKEREINKDLEGEQKDCPKGDKKVIDNVENKEELDDNDEEKDEIPEETIELIEELSDIEKKKLEEQKKALKDLCKRVIFPVLSLLSRDIRYNNMTFNEIINKIETKELINNIMREKKIHTNNMLNIYDTLNKIMESNQEIINNIREIYRTAPVDKIHSLISKHFIPSQDEKKKNAEIPTPIILVDNMLDKIDINFWKRPKKVFEPCCGKGNFVMRIFDKFYQGLADEYKDIDERCRIIVEECIYYADITILNVFITTEILKCEVESKTGVRDREYKFNFNTGNTLELNIKDKWNVDKFDAVIGNPPYNDNSGNKGKGHTLWTKFVEKTFSNWLKNAGILVYVHPSLWRQIEHPCLNLIKNKQIKYLEIHNVDDGQKMFRCATRYDWYVLENRKYTENTIIKSEDGKINNIDLREWGFIPNMMFEELKLLMNNNDKLDVNYYRSNYGADKKWVNKILNLEYKYPVVYSINKNNQLSLKYSNTNQNGHFTLTKFIFSNGAGFYCDIKGEYGLTQWAYCIYDNIEILPLIERTFRSDKFKIIKNAIQLDSSSYNIKVMKLFNKNFYLDFIDDNFLQHQHLPSQQLQIPQKIQPQQLQIPQKIQPQQLQIPQKIQPQQLQIPQKIQQQQLQQQQLQPVKTKNPKTIIEIKNNYTLGELEALNITTLIKIAKSRDIKNITKYRSATKNILAKLIYDTLNNE